MSVHEKEKSYVNWLYHVPGIGRIKLREILSHGITAEELYSMSDGNWQEYLFESCGFTKKQAETTAQNIGNWKKEKSPEQLTEELYNKKISFLLPGDPGYPKKLEEIPDAPVALYMKGCEKAAKSIEQKSVAIIGARECSGYGRSVAQLLGKCCAGFEMSVISGMAYGVDGISQSAALSEGGMVAAVLGCGVDVCYPYSNRKLYEELCQKGGVYSEYIPGTEPRAANFPPRNRIISGMADALIVVEAKEKSGTLITVDMALEQGKEVYVIPGRVSDPMSRGCNRLIKQGASIIYDVEEALEEIAGCMKQRKRPENLHSLREADNPYPKGSLRYLIYRSLDIQEKSVQQIYESLAGHGSEMGRQEISKLQTELFYMQMEGAIWENGGRFGVKL